LFLYKPIYNSIITVARSEFNLAKITAVKTITQYTQKKTLQPLGGITMEDV
jgi:hypothetical protein